MRARRDLEGAGIAPAEIHAVIAEVRAAAEIIAGDHPYARADGELRLMIGMAHRHHIIVHILRVLDHHFLTRRVLLGDDHRRQGMGQRLGQLHRAFAVVRPAEHLVHHIDIAEQIGHDPVVGLALHIVEQRRATAIQMFLQADNFEVGVDLLVRFDQIALGSKPLQGAAQIADRRIRLVRGGHILPPVGVFAWAAPYADSPGRKSRQAMAIISYRLQLIVMTCTYFS